MPKVTEKNIKNPDAAQLKSILWDEELAQNIVQDIEVLDPQAKERILQVIMSSVRVHASFFLWTDTSARTYRVIWACTTRICWSYYYYGRKTTGT